MRVQATESAVEIVERAERARDGQLTITIGTGCCESTAPFLYESFYPGPDQEPVGEVAGVVVYAPEYLRSLYPDDDGLVIDAVEVPAESMSIETEWGWRLILRGFGVDTGVEADGTCTVEPRSAAPREASIATGGPSRVRGELPDMLAALAERRHRR